jgi:hypothetical protein
LEIEITESVLLHNKEATLAVLHQLRALGIRIAMDDFGTGYSSLTYLQSFPFDKIKIDRSFVKNITEDSSSLNIVRAVAALANGMGMTATAEGVETAEQLHSIAPRDARDAGVSCSACRFPPPRSSGRFMSGRTRIRPTRPHRGGVMIATWVIRALRCIEHGNLEIPGLVLSDHPEDGVTPLKLRRDLRQHFEQRNAVGGAKQGR